MEIDDELFSAFTEVLITGNKTGETKVATRKTFLMLKFVGYG